MVAVVTATSAQERDGEELIFKAIIESYKKTCRVWVDGGYRDPKLMNCAA